jgi:hypothetical protein
LSTDKCVAFSPYAKCNDKPVLPSDTIFEPVPFYVPLSELENSDASPQATAKLEEIFRHLLAAALETADDVGVLGAKRKVRRAAEAVAAAPASASTKPAPHRIKPKERRRVQKIRAVS